MSLNRRRHVQRGGFTLLEILIVLTIIGVIASMVAPRLLGRQKEANIKTTKASIKGLEQTLELYAVEMGGEYPEGSQEALGLLLQPQVKADGGQIAPLLKAVPTDAWGQPFYYEYPNSKVSGIDEPAIWSSGPDGKNDNGGNDDINNWSDASV
jgi:general secretion pathway protein G